jgi:endonuclease YncB( thermonuclease family)
MRRGFMITAAAAALVMCAAQAASAASGWAIQPTPGPSGATSSGLSGVSCTAPTNCTAVGDYGLAGGGTATLAEYWDGSTWAIQPTPNPSGSQTAGLDAVSCASPASCMAVGSSTPPPSSGAPAATLAEYWDGSTWAIQPTPTRTHSSRLLGVSCPSATTCIAVGAVFNGPVTSGALAERWNGSTWGLQTIATPAGGTDLSLSGVSCTSGASCTAVGQYADDGVVMTLAEYWDGHTWAVQPTPNPAGNGNSLWPNLLGVSCNARTSCTAVGAYNSSAGLVATLAEHWDGSTWTIQPTPSPGGRYRTGVLDGVSCPSAKNCFATGPGLAERWNTSKSKWMVQSLATPPDTTAYSLPGVSCTRYTTSCTAVGYYFDSQSQEDTALAEAN